MCLWSSQPASAEAGNWAIKIHTYTRAHTHTYIYIYIYIYTYIYICYLCVYVYTYIYIYTPTYTHVDIHSGHWVSDRLIQEDRYWLFLPCSAVASVDGVFDWRQLLCSLHDSHGSGFCCLQASQTRANSWYETKPSWLVSASLKIVSPAVCLGVAVLPAVRSYCQHRS